MDHAEKMAHMEAHMTRLGIPKFVHSPPIFTLWWKAGVQIVPPLFARFWQMVAVLAVGFGVAALIFWFKQPSVAVVLLYVGLPISLLVPAFFRLIARRHQLPLWAEYEGDGRALPSAIVANIRKLKVERAKPLGFKEKLSGVLGLILLGLFIHLNMIWSIEAEADSLLSFVDEAGEGSYRDVGYSFDGSVEATNLEIQLHDAPPGSSPARIERVSLKTPGLLWMLRAGTPFEDEYPATQSLSLRMENVDWANWGMGRVIPELDWIGPYSGTLFEAAGCEKNESFSRAEVGEKFGAAEATGTILVEFNVSGPHTLMRRASFGGQAGSIVTQETEYTLAEDAEDFLESDTETWRTTLVRWTVEDQGFVRKRNRHCAREAKLAPTAFIDRHMASVQRLLLTDGFIPDPAVVGAYRNFAENGGKLVWETRLPPGRAAEDFANRGEADVLMSLRPTLAVNAVPKVAYSGRFVEPVALPQLGSTRSVVAALRQEGRLPTSTNPITPAMLESPDRSAGSVSTASVSALSSSVAPLPVEVPAESGPGADSASGTVLFESTVAAAETASNSSSKLSMRDLPRRIGQSIELTLDSGRRHSGRLERVDASGVRLKVSRRSGWASLTFARENIASIEAIGR